MEYMVSGILRRGLKMVAEIRQPSTNITRSVQRMLSQMGQPRPTTKVPPKTKAAVVISILCATFSRPEDCQTSVYSTPTRAYTKPRATPVISSCRIVSSIAFLPFLLM